MLSDFLSLNHSLSSDRSSSATSLSSQKEIGERHSDEFDCAKEQREIQSRVLVREMLTVRAPDQGVHDVPGEDDARVSADFELVNKGVNISSNGVEPSY